jgi:hypothetical protein
MKRRKFGLLAGASLAALNVRPARAANAIIYPAQIPKDPASLQSTLTPFGAIRAGNADGSIPAWTGGYNTPPPGWQLGDFIPDPNESDAVIVKIDASNMAQYSDYLSNGIMAMMSKYPDFFINVYPTHRTHCAPQDLYDNTALNVSRAQLSPAGPQLGFLNAVGGMPFPILDVSDPLVAGAQLYWNHYCAWKGRGTVYRSQQWSIANGTRYMSDESAKAYDDYPYYHKGVTLANFNGIVQRSYEMSIAPENAIGEEYLTEDFSNPLANANIVYELLNGQGRVRRAPEVKYDTPAAQVDGLADTDEYYGFSSQPDQYDWKYLGMKELFIPYNNNSLIALPGEQTIGPHFFDPNVVRFEKHRVHVVDGTVRPGRRNTLPHRIFYFDEDTFNIATEDAHDANDVLVHVNITYFMTRPDMPGTSLANNSVHNLQTGDWTPMVGPYDEKARPSFKYTDSWPDNWFDPNYLAASAQY